MQYRPELDGLRGVAVLGVVLFHSGMIAGGGRGVDIFFVLSGYLITALLLAEKERAGGINLPAFWARRAARLIPPLLAMLVAYVVLAPLFLAYAKPTLWQDVAVSAFYLMDYAQALDPWLTPLRHTWSLAVEEQFYLLWPFIVLAIANTSRDTAAKALLVLWGAITLGRIVAFGILLDWDRVYFPLHYHASGLVLGAIVVLLPRAPSWVGWCGLAGIAVSLFVRGENTSEIIWGITFAEISTAALISGMSATLARQLSWKPLVGLGLISYAVYLWHLPISEAAKGGPWLNTAITLTLSIACATISYFTVESWSRAIRKRLRRPAQSSGEGPLHQPQ